MPRSKGKKKNVQHVQAAAPRSTKGKKKRWELNLIKTGNISGSYMSGNTARSAPMDPRGAGMNARTRGIHFLSAPANSSAPATNAGALVRDQMVESDEVVGILSGNTSFESSALQIQPGLLSNFPWLGQLAPLYERYEFVELCYYYKPIVSGFAAQGQKGKVILSCDYDAAAGTLTSYRQAETMDPHADGMPYEAISLVLDPRRLSLGGKFIRRGPVPAGTDVKTYDAGTVYYSVSGLTDSTDIGEIRVRYRVRLMNPRLPDTATSAPPNFSVTVARSTSGVSNITSGWTIPILDWTVEENGLGVTFSPSGAPGLIRLAQGRYIVFMNFALVSTLATAAQVVATSIADGGSSVINTKARWVRQGANLVTTGITSWGDTVVGYFTVPEAGLDLYCNTYALFAGGTGAVAFEVSRLTIALA